jgi:hypothetical protein
MAGPQIEKVTQLTPKPAATTGIASSGDDGQIPPMILERLAKLEGAFDGLKMAIDGLRHGQNLIVGLLSVGFAIVIFFMGYLLTRIDNLPTEFERLNMTLSNAITASKQQAPQIILIPNPAEPAKADKEKITPNN